MNERKEMIQKRDQCPDLKDKINDYLVNEQSLHGAIAGISIASAADGSLFYESCGSIRLSPASNMKLFTAAAALSVLGEGYVFETQLLTDGVIEENVLKGNLFIQGKGDPTLLVSDLYEFANVLKSLGIEFVEGNLIADDTWYDHVRLSPDMIWSDEHFYYGSQISALTVSPTPNYHTGTVMVTVKPNHPGEKPDIYITPQTDYIDVVNTAVTKTSGTEEDLIIRREHGENQVIIEGSIPVTVDQIEEAIAVWEPTRYVMCLFQDALEKMDIKWKGKLQYEKIAGPLVRLYTKVSPPLSEILMPFMKLSNNDHGEMLVKEMGKVVHGEGSWEKGLDVLSTELASLGLDVDQLVIRDGSGISHVTLIPTREIRKLLYRVQYETWFPHFFRSLPVSGIDQPMIGGTLSDRLTHLDVQAKTGTIHGVSALSGYMKSRSETEVIFSILLNNLLDEEEGPPVIDRLLKIIADTI